MRPTSTSGWAAAAYLTCPHTRHYPKLFHNLLSSVRWHAREYNTGRNDGAPEVHPGQTPFNGTETWTKGNGGDARILLNQCYPSWDTGGWPRQESYFNQRYFWVNGEFTPRETMRGKMALLAYLHAIRSK